MKYKILAHVDGMGYVAEIEAQSADEALNIFLKDVEGKKYNDILLCEKCREKLNLYIHELEADEIQNEQIYDRTVVYLRRSENV